MDVSQSWQQIENWLMSAAADVARSLRPSAAASAVREAEAAFGLRFPAGFAASLARHDGQANPAAGLFPRSGALGPEPAWRLLALEEVQREWSLMKRLSDGGEFAKRQSKLPSGARAPWWSVGWIPIAGDGGGDLACLDLAADAPNAGNVIAFHHDGAGREVLSASFGEWLAVLAGKMEAGAIEFDRSEGLIESDAG